MKVTHIVPSINTESSGPSYSVVALCQALESNGVDTSLVVLDLLNANEKPGFVKSFPAAGFPARLGRSPEMRNWLTESAKGGRIDVMHNHSLWMMPNVYSCNAVKGTDVPLIVSPRGTMSDWAINSGSKVKKLFWPLIQRPALAAVTCFHATAESEYEDIRRLGFKQPVAIIPNGIDLPDLCKSNRDANRTLLFLGRIHPIKGLDMLLPAWEAVQNRFPEWQLRIVGPDNVGYLDKMKAFAKQLGLNRVEFTGPLSGNEKARAYADADLFVLPTYSENFGMTVAEALAAGTPAIVTKGAPWNGLVENGAGWWIDVGKDSLVACLENALSQPRTELDALGKNGRLWMEKDFSWKSVGDQMKAVYTWVMGGGLQPGFVHCD